MLEDDDLILEGVETPTGDGDAVERATGVERLEDVGFEGLASCVTEFMIGEIQAPRVKKSL